jgi:hypothetical protein
MGEGGRLSLLPCGLKDNVDPQRKKVGFAPSPRSGTTMALWPAKNMGVLFGGVYDDDTNEETLESVFHNDMVRLKLNVVC